jgi:hypothetical protein
MRRTIWTAMVILATLVAVPAKGADGYLWHHDGGSLFSLGWECGTQPMGSPQTSFSPVGLYLEYQKGVARQLSLGVALQYNRFDYQFDAQPGAHMNALALQATVHYYFTRSTLQPYVGLGAGGAWHELAASEASSDRGYGFSASGQVGVLLTVGTGVALNLALGYQFTTGTVSVNGDPTWSVTNPRWFWGNVGVSFY